MSKLFGTDGVRGIANKELTIELAYKLGVAGAYVLAGERLHKPKILVGCDTRISCDMLESALIAGICSTGATAVSLGVIPTPAVAYLSRLYEADAGIVISASHNSFEYNGIKFFSSQGYKLPDEVEDRIETFIRNDLKDIMKPVGEDVGRRLVEKDAIDDYVKYLISTIDGDFKNFHCVLDCANGAASVIAPMLFRKLGAQVTVINNLPDGININHKCGSTNMDQLMEEVIQRKADMGFAFDGDADRMLAVDDEGKLVDGDALMAILGVAFKKAGKLTNNTITATVMSNMGLDIMAKNNDIIIAKTTVGDRYVLEEMLKSGYILGGEQSGHILMLDYNTTGDGALTAIQIAKIVRDEKQSLSQIASIFKALPQVLINAKVRNDLKFKFMEDPDIADMCNSLEQEFNGEGRVLIRPSGTEPLVRVMIEGKDKEYIKRKADQLARLVESRLNI